MLGVGETQYVERKPFFLPQIDVRFVSNLVHTREKALLRRFFVAYYNPKGKSSPVSISSSQLAQMGRNVMSMSNSSTKNCVVVADRLI